ncbi:MAG: sugar phosphate isomerase/epimerase [Oscillospiraceae bacterium]|nr:sugar phosphate isomerase/epimerase [Oscillospiraceae bacterium]
MQKNKITAGISAACGYPEPPEIFIKALCELGVKRIELFVNCEFETRAEYIKEIKTILDANGAECVSLHPFTCAMDTYAMFSNYERRTQEYLDYHRRYFEAMNILGAKYFVFHGSKVNYGDELIFERFARLDAIAKDFGVKVLQENVNQRVTGELETLKRMKTHFGENAGFVLDTKQAVRMGWDPIDGVKALGSSIRHVHISDHGARGDCLPLGKGEMDVDAFVKALAQNGFEGAIMLELYRRGFGEPSELIDSLKTIERAIERL